jgi:hypothetical protein
MQYQTRKNQKKLVVVGTLINAENVATNHHMGIRTGIIDFFIVKKYNFIPSK